MYRLNAQYYGSVFVVPSVIVEKYIKMASFCAVKSLLWILKNQGSNYSADEIAKAIGSSPADTKEALDYWVNEGVLLDDEPNAVIPSPIKSDSYLKNNNESSKNISNISEKKPDVEIKIVRPTMEQIVNRMDEDKTIAGLLNEAQALLGRGFGYDMQSAILMMVDTYGLPVDIILDLIQYCVELGKTGNAFIISVAKAWYEKDITTPEKVQEYISQHNEADKLFKDFCQLTGISTPKATPKQTELLISWRKMGFSVDMIALAYYEAVERTGKISYPYMNKVLLNWNEKGFKTPEDIEKDKEEYKKAKAGENKSKQSYDISKAINSAANGEFTSKKRKGGKTDEV